MGLLWAEGASLEGTSWDKSAVFLDKTKALELLGAVVAAKILPNLEKGREVAQKCWEPAIIVLGVDVKTFCLSTKVRFSLDM